ncbi:MAG: helix-turn-helix domain-containing protein, partial [bacterium]|nr:helix-turn-helix domain-containing protein [bacterium]
MGRRWRLQTGYKIFNRYKDCGLDGLTDRSRRPYRQANRLPVQIERLTVRLKKERPSWGALRSAEQCVVPGVEARLPAVRSLDEQAVHRLRLEAESHEQGPGAVDAQLGDRLSRRCSIVRHADEERL